MSVCLIFKAQCAHGFDSALNNAKYLLLQQRHLFSGIPNAPCTIYYRQLCTVFAIHLHLVTVSHTAYKAANLVYMQIARLRHQGRPACSPASRSSSSWSTSPGSALGRNRPRGI